MQEAIISLSIQTAGAYLAASTDHILGKSYIEPSAGMAPDQSQVQSCNRNATLSGCIEHIDVLQDTYPGGQRQRYQEVDIPAMAVISRALNSHVTGNESVWCSMCSHMARGRV